jgi:ketosteroid isomerase-like protein
MLIVLAMMAAMATQPSPATSTFGSGIADPQDRARDEAIIRARASAWGAAFMRGDVGAIDSLLADDFIGTAKNGTLYDKPTMRGWVVICPNLTSSRTSVNRVRFFGEIAIATGTDDMIGPAPAYRRIRTVWTDIWISRGGQWLVIAAHDMAGKPD